MTGTTLIAIGGLFVLCLGLAAGSAYTYFHEEQKNRPSKQ